MAEEITALWPETEQQKPHRTWLPVLKEWGIAYTTANHLIRLRQQYFEINQIGEFGTVSAALTRSR